MNHFFMVEWYGSIFVYRRYPANSCSFRWSMFWPHLQGHSVVSLPQASRLHSRSLKIHICVLGRFTLTIIFEKIKCLNRLKMLSSANQIFYTPMTQYACSAKREWPSASYRHPVTPRVPRSVQAKFHVNGSKTVSARGLSTHGQT